MENAAAPSPFTGVFPPTRRSGGLQFVKNLKIWQKLALMGLAFMIPLLAVSWRLISSMNDLGIVFAQKEVAGVQVISPLHKLLEDTQAHQVVLTAAAHGEGSRDSISANASLIKEDLAAVDKALA